ncbi:hypothetical protein AOQ84DRAFT_376505 [Glonium stellatum]|uniref:Uncharacterized protein n=1 Tax=Glonium stellatum TaxID=574774 RepID=A0A8E2JT52_9PEZI|nr:hypothetical protein AOQ84DRAFT_376505 [Glonium stellatum]
MTPRSPKPLKSSTISRRLRSRAEQNLSVQPPEIPQLRNLRSRRAATQSSSSRAISSSSSLTDQDQDPVWTAAEILEPFPRGTTSDPVGFAERPDADSSLLLSQTLDLPPFPSSHQRTSNLSSLSRTSETGQYDISSSSGPDILSSHLASLHENSPGEEFSLRLSAESELHSNPSVEIQDMSTLGFMVPSQYGSLEHYGSPAPLESQNYSLGQQQHYSGSRQQQHQPQTSSAYAPTYTASPALRGHPNRTPDQAVIPPYQSTQVPRSPYQQPLGSMRASPGPIGYPASSNDGSSILGSPPHSYSYPALQPTIAGQNIGPLAGNSSSYPPYVIRP